MSRVMLFSGKGGVGKTTSAAATAVLAAERGHRVLVVSLDRAHNLGDVLTTPLGADPREIPGTKGRLHALEADPQVELARHWRALSGYFARLLEWAGVGGAEADEVAVFPGLEELLVLSRLTEIVDADDYDLVVVDLAPTASSLRMLSFPELMAGPLGRFARLERGFLRVARPALRGMFTIPVPEDELYAALEVLSDRIGRLRGLLTDPMRTVVRLVAIPERVVIDETRSAFTLLSLFGLCIDAVVMNRVLPRDVQGGSLDAWVRIQKREMDRANELFGSVKLLPLRFQPHEVLGSAALSTAGREIYGSDDPAKPFSHTAPLRFRRERGRTVLEIHLPHADARSLDLKHRDDELIVTVAGWRRQLPLPTSLRGCAIASARFHGDSLAIRFEPDKEKTR